MRGRVQERGSGARCKGVPVNKVTATTFRIVVNYMLIFLARLLYQHRPLDPLRVHLDLGGQLAAGHRQRSGREGAVDVTID